MLGYWCSLGTAIGVLLDGVVDLGAGHIEVLEYGVSDLGANGSFILTANHRANGAGGYIGLASWTSG